MNVLYVNASAGVNGGMLLKGMLDLGLPPSRVKEPLRRLGSGAAPLAGDLIRWIHASSLRPTVRSNLLRVWTLLARAEGEAHGCPWGQVRFHQLARPETMKNIVGFCAGLSYFHVSRVYTGPVPMGNLWRDPSGRQRREPGPAASRLLKRARLPIKYLEDKFEWTTPTGAALLAAFASPDPPPLRVLGISLRPSRWKSPGGRRPPCLILARTY